MDNILFINACVRGTSTSRTYKIANHFLQEYKKHNPNCNITELTLTDLPITCFSNDNLKNREKLLEQGDYENPMFNLARQFASASKIVIAAPFWEFSFPAILKVYVENIAVAGITFTYNSDGMVGICKAEKMLFITTRGGVFTEADTCELEMGSRYLKALCKMFGIDQYECLYAEGLDVIGNNVDDIISETIKKAINFARKF
ncbi:NAD(P)H-dependent oxidoreductase [Clostridium sp. PL3]|uniref:FMN dependent NADH:quinone oxidoreductase n=1 Tax=Clostridium thailandense TaxID=2794346 RepID=A0A949TYG8_9CLOT|nr:NAD(P)H-dependent oxidoreductase [Clostridium thailandense]MBV7275936.1 NAD(P)H-dependent oxidoreductase [Clostridium thailandense]